MVAVVAVVDPVLLLLGEPTAIPDGVEYGMLAPELPELPELPQPSDPPELPALDVAGPDEA